MKLAAVLSCIFSFILLLLQVGCESPQVVTNLPLKPGNDSNGLAVYIRYAPDKIYILPLTEFIHLSDIEKQPQIKVHVSLLDQFGSQIKSPGVFRFELYEYVPRSAEPKGKRIVIWPDIDLTESADNNLHWRDFLRAYEFSLPSEPESNKSYILQATCLCPNGRRLSAEFILKHSK